MVGELLARAGSGCHALHRCLIEVPTHSETPDPGAHSRGGLNAVRDLRDEETTLGHISEVGVHLTHLEGDLTAVAPR
jgi:hypothetical protein